MKLPKCCTTVTPLSKTLAILLFVSLPFIGFRLGQEYQKTLDPSPPSPPTSFTVIPQSLKLGSVGQYEYDLVWHGCKGYEDLINEQTYSFFESDINLIRHLPEKGNQLIAPKIFTTLCYNKNGLLTLLSAPQNSSQVYISQGRDGTDGRSPMLLNLENGEITHLVEISDKLGYSCMDMNPVSPYQRGIVFSCVDNKIEQESLYSLDIATGKVKKIKTLDSSLTYRCTPGYGHAFSYKQINDQSISIDICAGKNKVNKVTVNF